MAAVDVVANAASAVIDCGDVVIGVVIAPIVAVAAAAATGVDISIVPVVIAGAGAAAANAADAVIDCGVAIDASAAINGIYCID